MIRKADIYIYGDGQVNYHEEFVALVASNGGVGVDQQVEGGKL
jgi:hypothetical protein